MVGRGSDDTLQVDALQLFPSFSPPPPRIFLKKTSGALVALSFVHRANNNPYELCLLGKLWVLNSFSRLKQTNQNKPEEKLVQPPRLIMRGLPSFLSSEWVLVNSGGCKEREVGARGKLTEQADLILGMWFCVCLGVVVVF